MTLQRPHPATLQTLLLIWTSIMATQCAPPSSDRSRKVIDRLTPHLTQELATKELQFGAPIFIRILKESRELELWVQHSSGPYKHFKTYAIAAYSGTLGPKLQEGDRQAPEGFYTVPAKSLHPTSSYHLALNIGYPNAYDRAHDRTGSFIMIHGKRASIGCFAMTDPRIEEIYTLAHAALRQGQPHIHVHSYPFHMTPERLANLNPGESKWLPFWQNLKQGYDHFQTTKLPPNVTVKNKHYTFTPTSR